MDLEVFRSLSLSMCLCVVGGCVYMKMCVVNLRLTNKSLFFVHILSPAKTLVNFGIRLNSFWFRWCNFLQDTTKSTRKSHWLQLICWSLPRNVTLANNTFQCNDVLWMIRLFFFFSLFVRLIQWCIESWSALSEIGSKTEWKSNARH